MAEDFLALMQRLAPDLAEEMALRALVLERVAALGPVGRRQLAARLHLPEREIRTAADFLREQGLIRLDAAGMTLAPEATALLPGAREFSRAMQGLTRLEGRLAAALRVERLAVVPGDGDQDPRVLEEVGRVTAQRLRALLHNGSTLAVAGGETMALVARALQAPTPLNVMVVPARGGMGRRVETQANTVAAEIARRIGGHCRLIYLPDRMDASAVQEMLRLPEVKEAAELLERADVVLHGVSRAEDAARVARMPVPQMKRLLEQGAVAEALGQYLNGAGAQVYAVPGVGIDLSRLPAGCRLAAAAAGRSKAEAILAAARGRRYALLVIDEGAAEAMLRLLSLGD